MHPDIDHSLSKVLETINNVYRLPLATSVLIDIPLVKNIAITEMYFTVTSGFNGPCSGIHNIMYNQFHSAYLL